MHGTRRLIGSRRLVLGLGGMVVLGGLGVPGATSRARSGVVVVAPAAPQAKIDVHNAGYPIERDACTLVRLGGQSASECGNLRVTHTLPGVRIFNTEVAPTLLYNSEFAHPYPLIPLFIRQLATTTQPDSVEATVHIGIYGQTLQHKVTRAWPGSHWPGGQLTVKRVTLTWDGLADTTGYYYYKVEVRNYYGSTPTTAAMTDGKMFIINRSQSPYGAGWWLAGQEQLLNLGSVEKVWIGGDGSARFFLNFGTNTSYAPLYDRQDSLVYAPGTATWTRWTPEGRRVVFDAAGKHLKTINRFGRETTFGYTGALLTSISLPSPTGLSYSFGYTSSRLTSVTAPPVGGPRVSTLVNPVGRLESVRNAGDSLVVFRYLTSSGDAHLMDRRTDRRGVATDFTYDAARRVSSSTVSPGGGAATIIWSVIPGETQGFATPVDTPTVRTFVNGPRPVADTTAIYANRFGHPRKVVDAEGALTRQWFDDCGGAGQDCTWQVSRQRNPAGNESYLDWDRYDAVPRGNLKATRRMRDVSLSLMDTTSYQWDGTFDQLTRIDLPGGEFTQFGVNAVNGRREWQEDVRGTSSRVNITYNPFGAFPELPTTIVLPAINGTSVNLNYDYHSTLANLSQESSGRGEVNTYGMDAIGRVTSVESPIDSMSSTNKKVRVATGYSLRGDRLADTTITVNVSPSERIVVRSFFNGEGQPDSVHRSVTPDTAALGLMRTRWTYDLVGRTLTTIDANGKQDSVVYDAAGNVTRTVNRRYVGGTIDTAQYVAMAYDRVNRMIQRIIPGYTYPAITSGLGHAAYAIPSDTQSFGYSVLGQVDTANNRYARIARTYSARADLLSETARIHTTALSPVDFSQHVYTTQWRYDAQGRRTSLKLPASLLPSGQDSIRYTYTAFGALHQVFDPSGVQFDHAYNARTELDSVRNVTGGYVQRWTYDDNGDPVVDRVRNLGSKTWPRFTIDTLRNTRVSLDGRGKVLVSRDSTGYRDTLTTTYGGLGALEYSRLVQRADLAYGLAGAPPTAVRLISTQDPAQDALGNIVQDTRRDSLTIGAGTPSVTTDIRTYAYLAGTGRLNQDFAGAYIRTYTYDASGNTSRSFRAGGGGPAYDQASYYCQPTFEIPYCSTFQTPYHHPWRSVWRTWQRDWQDPVEG